VLLEYDNAQLSAAFGSVFADEPDTLARALAADDGMGTALAVELATHMSPSEERISDNATAALCGLITGARLADAGDRLPDALPAAVETVRVLGRARVIATHCDLGGVAAVEQVLERGFGSPGGEDRESLLQLFELGLAIGLASSYA
jgi:hypothetical protein